MQLPEIFQNTFIHCENVDQRKQVIKILEGHEWSLIDERYSFEIAPSVIVYPKDREFETSALQAVDTVISAKSFINSNQ